MTLELLYNWTLMLLKNLFVLKVYVSAHQAWLDPVNLPSGKSSSCDFCGNPLRFVLQVLFCFSYNSRCTDLFMFRIGSQLGCRCAGLCTNSVKGNCLPSHIVCVHVPINGMLTPGPA